jgi:circadian clock protein KaiC
VLSGGLPQGHLYLVEGNPGTGKTTLGLQFLLAGAREGEKVMYVTLSESREEIEGVAAGHGWSLEGVSVFEYTPDEQSLRPEDQYTAFHPSEIELGDTTQSILAEIEKLGPTRIVFDSLSEIRLLARDSLRYRRQILGLKQFFSHRGCTVVLLDDRTAEGSEYLQLQSIAHGVLMMTKFSREYGRNRRRLEVVKLRGSTFREGYHDYVIETGGVTVYPSLVAAEHGSHRSEGLALSGIPELDRLWGGGVECGTSTLLIGPAGVGKSTICTSYVAAAAGRNQHASFYTFDEGRETVIHRAESLGIPLRRHIDSGQVDLRQIDPAELSPGAFIQRIRDAVERKRTKLLVLDSVNGLIHSMPAEEALMLQMHELLAYLSQRGVTSLMVLSQAGVLGSSMHSPVNLSYLSDNMLLLRYFEAQGKVRKAISVVKKRTGEHEDSIRELRMTNGKLVVGDPLVEFSGVLTGSPQYIGQEVGTRAGDGLLGA